MNILFVCDYFPPFVKGGGEISAFWQAKKLAQIGVKVVVLTPKYKDKLKIRNQIFKQYWYNFPFKANKTSPVLFLNPFYIFCQFFHILKICKKEKPDLIHCQQKYSAPAVILAKIFLKIPVVLTLRDYKGICSHGFCLWKSKKGCSLLSFFKKDFLFYYKNYIKDKNIFSFLGQLMFSYFGMVSTLMLSFFMKKADKFIAISDYVKNVYVKNGFEGQKITTIYNFSPKINITKEKIPREISEKLKFKYLFLYGGKLSLGKGADFMILGAENIVKKRKDVLFIFAGNIHYPIKKIKNRQLLFLGRVEYLLLLKIISLVDVVCIPSAWPEPLSRVVLEAFLLGKPVLSTYVGGLPELVNDKTGWLFKPSKQGFKKGIKKVFKDEKKWQTLGKNGKQMLKKLEKKQLEKLMSLYESVA